MAGSIGSVYIDVLPDLSRFTADVAAGIGRNKPVKVQVDADTTKAAAGVKGLVGSNSQLDASIRRLASAQGTLRVADARLAETRAKAVAGSARLISAQESQARALRNVESAQVAYAAATDAASQKTGGLLRNIDSPAVQKFGSSLMVAGAAVAFGLGAAVKVTADFDQAVSNVAATAPDAAANIGRLRDEALKYGADTAFSAREAADAQAELIKANVSVSDTINGGLKGALDLAAAGSLDVATAAGIMATSMSQFGIEGAQASHVADLLAAGAGKAQGEVTDFAGALKYVGPVAKGMGISIEETVGALALFANAGIVGEQAGTSLRGVLTSLTSPSEKAAETMRQYGIEVYDAQGKFVGLEGVAGQLQSALGGLTESQRDAALGTLFGNAQITAARVLYSGGAADVQKWTTAVNDSGFAQETARVKMNNLRGDVERFTGALQSAAIGSAESSTGPLRSIVQAATGVVDAYEGMSDSAKGFAFSGAGIVAAAALGVGGIIKLGGAAKSAKDAITALNITMRGAALASGAIGVGLAAAVAIVGHFAVENAQASGRVDDLTQSLLQSKGAIDSNIASMRAKALEDSGALKAADSLGVSYEDITQASLGNAEAQARVNAVIDEQLRKYDALGPAVAEAQNNQTGFKDNALTLRDAMSSGNEELNEANAAYQRQQASINAVKTETGALTAEQKSNLSALLETGNAIESMSRHAALGAEGVQALTSALYSHADAAIAAKDAEVAFEQAIDDAAAAAKENGKSLDVHTQAGRNNLSALSAQAQASQDYVASLFAQGKGVKEATSATRDARSAFIDNAVAMGASKKRAGELATEYGLIPKDVRTRFAAQIEAQEQAKITKLTESILKLPPEQQTRIRALVEAGDLKGAQAEIDRLAKPLTTRIAPQVDQKAQQLSKGKLDYFGHPITKPVNVKTKGVPKAKGDIASVKGKNAEVKVRSTGVPKTKADIANVKGKNAEVRVRSTGVPRTKGDIASVKGKNAEVKVRSTGVPATKGDIASVKGKSVTVNVNSSGVDKVKALISSITGKTVTIFQKLVKGNAAGGPVGRAGGGIIPGNGGPTDDDVPVIDRATGRVAVMASSREFITNAAQYARNRAAVETINAGGDWDLVPRRALGGQVARTSRYAETPALRERRERQTIVVNIDLGGGLRRVVQGVVDDNGVYELSIDRMGV